MLATALDGIGRLWDLIMQFAVQGRRHPLRRDVTDVFLDLLGLGRSVPAG
ncbi:hypothetical protein [Methanosphaerula palustris]|uniref:Uncharacterized protein n=1 Tax=Methanosphaerula palustris (strain ATCC BAA-1556 / DSM 19958 / E1-9c) TaxID=521011 RepID=B8GIV9_METPE|nr:hypothetical protein [Methanosphaerula palustris]ACL16922.1 hypothetical protein Mpal_1610 [Methanosphaerula palustris E1-9c]